MESGLKLKITGNPVMRQLDLNCQPHFPTENILQISESKTAGFSHKIVFMHLALLARRIKYYVTWFLAEGALVLRSHFFEFWGYPD